MEDPTQPAHIPLPQPISTISQDVHVGRKYNRMEILSALQKLAPISLYEASKKLHLKYNTLSNAVREFEFAGLLKTKMEIKGHVAVRIIYFEDNSQGQRDEIPENHSSAFSQKPEKIISKARINDVLQSLDDCEEDKDEDS